MPATGKASAVPPPAHGTALPFQKRPYAAAAASPIETGCRNPRARRAGVPFSGAGHRYKVMRHDRLADAFQPQLADPFNNRFTFYSCGQPRADQDLSVKSLAAEPRREIRDSSDR